MNVGLVGFPLVGRSTLFRAVSHRHASGDLASVPVPDPRFDALCTVSGSKKHHPAHVDFHDNVGRFEPGHDKAARRHFFEAARKMDLLLHVVRAFDNPMAPYHAELDPLRDHRALEEELILEDLGLAETRVERLERTQATVKPGSPEANELRLLSGLAEGLAEGKAVRSIELSPEEAKIISGFQFLSEKPLVCALNVDEAAAASPPEAVSLGLSEYCSERGIPCVSLCASLEEEIAALDEKDQGEFLGAMGLTVPASHRMIRAVYDGLGLITFYTLNQRETRAWPFRKGGHVHDAAGTIHSDLARGFIRAEVARVEDCIDAGGWDQVHTAGKTELHGKEYIVQDGDIIQVRFKV
jgi:GTP-binding protein YchF